jgi:hypothetical protein
MLKCIFAIAGIAMITIQCKSPVDAALEQTANSTPFKVTATAAGSDFTGGAAGAAVQPYPGGGDMFTVSASQVIGTTGSRTITINVWAQTGKTAPFTAVFPSANTVATYTETPNNSAGNNSHTYTTQKGSGSISFTHWESKADGSGYAEGTFSFTAKDTAGAAVTVSNGAVKKN